MFKTTIILLSLTSVLCGTVFFDEGMAQKLQKFIANQKIVLKGQLQAMTYVFLKVGQQENQYETRVGMTIKGYRVGVLLIGNQHNQEVAGHCVLFDFQRNGDTNQILKSAKRYSQWIKQSQKCKFVCSIAINLNSQDKIQLLGYQERSVFDCVYYRHIANYLKQNIQKPFYVVALHIQKDISEQSQKQQL